MRLSKKLLLCLILASVSPAWAQDNGGDIPAHPRDLKFKPLEFDPPQRADHRHELAHGVVAYMVEDHDLPLVDVRLILRAGSYLDPPGKTGLASAVGSLLRSGGTARWNADEFDEEADFLAANISSSIGETSGSASVNALSKDIDQALEMFFEMIRNPAFQQDRIDLRESQALQQMERRNDRTSTIESREWERLMRGTDHFSTAQSTKATVEAIGREDMTAFHARTYVPANFIFAVSGDFDAAQMKEKLNRHLAAWDGPGESSPPIPEPEHTPVAGVYMVNKSDVNQGRVSIGHLGIRRGNPDEFAIDMMNDILGGSGFTSRITNRIRSDEGLAYTAGSFFSTGVYYPGIFRALFQSKSPTCAEAATILLEEIKRIRTAKVTQDELDTVRAGAIETFPRRFSSARAVAGTFAFDELTGQDPEYWNTYRDKLKAVTVDDVQRVAQQYLHPDKMVILAVGNVEDMLKGNPDKPQYSFEKLAPGGQIIQIPLPDPLTMEYPQQ